MRKRIIMMKGLPASGKSTYARELVDKHQQQLKRINKDDLRAMVDNWKRSKWNEKMIINFRNTFIREALVNNTSVIVDDTNFDPKHEKELRGLAEEFWAEFEVVFIDTPLDECIERDKNRPNPVWKKVIKDMYDRYLKKWFVQKPHIDWLPNCIIVDIDWTLAQKWDRDIYDWSKVYLDSVIEPVRQIVWMYDFLRAGNEKIFIFSWRDWKYYDVTEKRLANNLIPYHVLSLREPWDTRPDTIVKKEMYDKYIDWKYNVLFALDDRVCMVDMWRDMWIYTFDCNQTRSEF